WGSLCSLFESAVASCEVLNDVLMKTGSFDCLLAPSEKEEISVAAKFYRVILDLMTLLQSSKKPSINMVVLGIIDIESTLRELEDDITASEDDTTTEFRKALAETLLQCVQGRMRPFGRMEILGALLDPEMKDISKVRAEVPGGNPARFLLDAVLEYTSLPVAEEAVQVIEPPPTQKPRYSLTAKYGSLCDPFENMANQVDRYLASPVRLSGSCGPDDRDEVLKWWSQNESTFPAVANLARIILSIPATSAEPERRFSIAGNLLREKRCSMNPITATRVLFVHDNKEFL
ncbi:zinc finger BED domain-containing protein 1-like, partial [Galendromus occidentalis]|uniref:Zinc finger BED domain-containing protein 1-like n=1 Tax=Galendromus occidentalis TaxID=34638 RepID=A0AAJ6QMZ9_9ACAR